MLKKLVLYLSLFSLTSVVILLPSDRMELAPNELNAAELTINKTMDCVERSYRFNPKFCGEIPVELPVWNMLIPGSGRFVV
ncbi:MAG: hypothetical protein ABFS56_00530 [Pseudomonadota bacterium]